MRKYQDYLHIHDGIENEFEDERFLRQAWSYDRIYSRFLPEPKDIRILDVGCGTGMFLYYLKRYGYKNYYGIDISEENIKFVLENVTNKCECKDIFEFLRDKENCFDVLVMNEVLEHIPKEETLTFTESAYKSLKADGQLFVMVPNMENPITVYTRWHDFTHSTGFTNNSLKMVLRLSGFKVIDVYPTIGFSKQSLLERTAGRVVRFITRRYLEKVFQYPKDGILFSKRILAVAKK